MLAQFLVALGFSRLRLKIVGTGVRVQYGADHLGDDDQRNHRHLHGAGAARVDQQHDKSK